MLPHATPHDVPRRPVNLRIVGPDSAFQFAAPGDGIIGALAAQFQGISLEETNKSAKLLKRVDNKYVVGPDELKLILGSLNKTFWALEIDGRRVFSYRSCYFDDDFACYYDHHQGRRLRFKVRTRHYVDSGEVYFEVKLKDTRGKTIKKRIKCDDLLMSGITGKKMSMLKKFYRKSYGKDFTYNLSPALIVSCNRATFVSAIGGERVTVDFNLVFESPDGSTVEMPDDVIIVETKSGDGKGMADQVLKEHRIRKSKNCSKYCIGAVLTGSVNKDNNFRPILKTVREKTILKTVPNRVGVRP